MNKLEQCIGGGCSFVEDCSKGGLLNLKRITEDPKHEGVDLKLRECLSEMADAAIDICQGLDEDLRPNHVAVVSRTAAVIAILDSLPDVPPVTW